MRRVYLLLFLTLMTTVASHAQDGKVTKGYYERRSSFSYRLIEDDPAFDYIRCYGPDYYIMEESVGGKFDINIDIRTLYNYRDAETYSQIILSTKRGEVRELGNLRSDDYFIWEWIGVDELEQIINFLTVASNDKKPDKRMTRVYNSRSGILFLAKGNEIDFRFPDSAEFVTMYADDWIPLFKDAKNRVKPSTFGVYDSSLVESNDEPESPNERRAIANVTGRNVLGSLPKPSYNTRAEGTVVVQVKVDQYGTVTEAIPGAEGTTVRDKTLWNSAQNAALKAHFNQSANAPALQTGTITYIFRIK